MIGSTQLGTAESWGQWRGNLATAHDSFKTIDTSGKQPSFNYWPELPLFHAAMTKRPAAIQSLRAAALTWLARREHSRQELRRKLMDSCPVTTAQLDAIFDTLETEGLLSDKRFAESLTRMHVRRGHGPVRIRFELRERGISEELIATTLGNTGIDWTAMARELIDRRFGALPVVRGAALAKRMRFLHQRGFSGEQIRVALAGKNS